MMRYLTAFVVLSACVAAPDTPTTGTIRFGNGGSITGPGATTTVTADDRVTVSWGGFGAPPAPPPVTVPGAHARAVAVLRDAGLRAQAALPSAPRDIAYCPDYGEDEVRADPPVAGFSRVVAGCPEPQVTALIGRLQAAVAP
jgi:hypothetical protein